MADANQPKIIVDDDWKSAARAEKEKLAQTEAAQKPSDPSGEMPEKPSLEHLVSLLASQALMYLGQIPDQSGRGVIALDIAKMQIDLIGVIEEKTKGNLSEEETTLVQGTLNELRMVYVEIHDAVMKAQAEGKITAEQVSKGFSPGPMPG